MLSCRAGPGGRWNARSASSPDPSSLGSIAVSIGFPAARYLAGAVGAGLTYAAVSDTCTMARVLSRLPYNRDPQRRSAQQVLADLPPRRIAA